MQSGKSLVIARQRPPSSSWCAECLLINIQLLFIDTNTQTQRINDTNTHTEKMKLKCNSRNGARCEPTAKQTAKPNALNAQSLLWAAYFCLFTVFIY